MSYSLSSVLPSFDELPDLLTPEQVRELTGLSVQGLANNRANHRDIPYTKIGRRVRYPKKLLGEYLIQNLRGGK
jgi:hypothetical protein